MPARVWTALAGLIAVLLIAVVGLDQWQSRRGEPSLFGLPWGSSPAPAASATARAVPKPRDPLPASSTPSVPQSRLAPQPPQIPRPPQALTSASRVAIIVDDLGARRDVFDPLRDIRRPLTIAVLPGLP